MRIVFLAPFGLRPKGTVLARMIPLAAGLQRLGHEVVIVAPPYTNPEDSGRVEVVEGVTVKNITLGPRSQLLAAPVLSWRLWRAALAERPDLVHLFKPKGYGGIAAMLHLAAARLGVRMPPLYLDTDDWEGKGGMNDLHGYSAAQRMIFSLQERWLPQLMCGVTVASRALEQRVAERGVSRERLLYLPNCVREQVGGRRSEQRLRLGIAGDEPVLLLYTRFFEFSQKRLYRIFAEVCRQLPDIRFLVVGQGRAGEDERLVAASRELGFEHALIMAGWIEPTALPDYLAAADLAIYPFDDTVLNRAKCPAKLTELLAAGLPVVADRVGQISEYLDPELQLLLLEPGGTDDMASRVVTLLRNRESRRQYGERARQYILQHFSWDTYVQLLNDFYIRCGDGPTFSLPERAPASSEVR